MGLFKMAFEEMNIKPWTGFDLDGTMAEYDEWRGIEHIGAPIMPMVNLAKELLAKGEEVKIMTARVAGEDGDAARGFIEAWSLVHIGQIVPVTNEKDQGMIKLYDDKAVQVVENTGEIVEA
jgi:hypothetical protein